MKKEFVTNLILEKVESILLEGRLEDVKAKYPQPSWDKIDTLSEKDISGNNKYLDWMAKNTLRPLKFFQDLFQTNRDRLPDNFNYDGQNSNWRAITDNWWYRDFMNWTVDERTRLKLFDNLEYFHQNPTKYEKKDINQYKNLQEFDDATEKAKSKLSRKEEKEGGVDKIFEDENFILLLPRTHKASCRYGSNTRWCVTMRGYDR